MPKYLGDNFQNFPLRCMLALTFDCIKPQYIVSYTIESICCVRLTKLRLNGFKSFVDPTDLSIQDGLTGVVGPNGCGKSNLLEALRWVMGENRPTAMRSGGMEDVIFGGAATRGARNFAEVVLHIDNSERLAPAEFNIADHIDITRRITRDAGSAYKLNGKDVRARDVQMLFADASTGAQSPALVQQGQITELINARPRARRRILDEAAGISGLYQRRHEAELKLNAAETNLARVDDILEGLTNQLITLTRQAKQAARYREIGVALRHAEMMMLYLRWRNAQTAHLEAEGVLRNRLQDAAQAEVAVRQAAAAREKAEAAVRPLREDAAIAGAIVQRLTVEHATLEAEAKRAKDAVITLRNRAEQLHHDQAREIALRSDAEQAMARLQAEQNALHQAQGTQEATIVDATTQAEAADHILQHCEADLSKATEDAAHLAAQHQTAERHIAEAQAAIARHNTAHHTAHRTATTLQDDLTALDHEHTLAVQAAQNATDCVTKAEAAVADLHTTQTRAQTAEASARAHRTEVEARATTLAAEVQTLSHMLDHTRGTAGQMVDDISVDKGFEAALGAALTDDLLSGRAETPGATGWTDLPNYDAAAPLPHGARPIASVVRAPAMLARRLAHVGLVPNDKGAEMQASLRPGQRLVSVEGHMWRWDGFSIAAHDAVSSATRHLEHMNRLADLNAERETARAAAEKAQAHHKDTAAHLAHVTQTLDAARSARRNADVRLATAQRTLSKTEAERTRLQGQLTVLQDAAQTHAQNRDTAEKDLTHATAASEDLGDLTAARQNLATLREKVEAARTALMGHRATRDDLMRQAERQHTRLQDIGLETQAWAERLAQATQRSEELKTRRTETDAALQKAEAQPEQILTQTGGLQTKIKEAEARLTAANDALAAAESTHKDALSTERNAERAASTARENRAAAEAHRDAAAAGVTAAVARIAEDRRMVTPQALRDALGDLPTPLPQIDIVEADLARLHRRRDALGAVNLRAEDDARDLQTEHDTLSTEKTDLETAIAKLRTSITALNKQGRARLLTAFDAVNDHFAALFTHLFGGGEARLVLVESDDPLEAGLEILCQPPGKKLSTLSLLSGGEQTLTALALIFAVFLVNPAPICVLDEVDAPLDDANVGRFCDLLDEMTRKTATRFLIITHHAITMARMDRLFGVTMAEQGVSQLVGVDLIKAEKMVA